MPGRAIRLRGVVQGVGMRPAIWHLARKLGLCGEVCNDGEGVLIEVFGTGPALDDFIAQIPLHLPPLARLDSLQCWDIEVVEHAQFRIVTSRGGPAQTVIAADAASCSACLAEIADPVQRRYRYPFTNCTHCGPRLSIVRGVPYDRANTSMAAFPMCPDCHCEYDDPADRRFHAQANCCPACGPRLWLEDRQGLVLQAPAGLDVIQHAASLIRQGHIVAVKGLGGFHLACDAGNAEAVARLRQRKHRDAKPFALMASDPAMISRYAVFNAAELQALQSAAAPIVLLAGLRGHDLADVIAPDSRQLGFMLPYTPLHTLLMQELRRPIVLTSGNRSDQPQCISHDAARQQLVDIADFWLLHDRDIVNRLDDSLARLMAGEIRLLRRGRGYAPQALLLPEGFQHSPPLLALGGELKNTFCLLQQGRAVISQHIGDLEDGLVQVDYRQAIALYRQLHDFTPATLAIDAHDGYLSSQYGRQLAAEHGWPIVGVQHHHAHLAACLAEHGVGIDQPPLLAAIFDGLGLGEDGTLWGGEFFLGNYHACQRLAYFENIAMPGGAQAIREPWRNAYAQLRHYFDWRDLQRDYADLAIIDRLNHKPLAILDTMLDQSLNSPLSSSCGRWFDAFAAALGLHAESIVYEGQAAIALENLAAPAMAGEQAYANCWSVKDDGPCRVLRWQRLWLAVLDDLQRRTPLAIIAARIHHSLAAATCDLLLQLQRQTQADRVVLSGGVFQNRLLLETVVDHLRQHALQVLIPRHYPMNDGGLALGQALIAAARRSSG